MKGQLLLNPFGRPSTRNVVLFIATLVVTVFSYILFASPAVHAAGEATWENGNLTYQDKIFNPYDAIKEGSSSGLPAGTKVFIYTPQGGFGQSVRVEMIYFGKNENPKTATAATYITYMQTPPDQYSDPQGKKSIQLVAMSQADREETTTSCIVDGIGWIVCPVTKFLSKAMDWLFDVMSSFLTVRPVQTDQESVLYRGWSMMRNIANVAFVIAFLIVIYSQVTNIGLSSYGIKRMLPRLIAAAILVNISYWICAIAVDLSNIAGYSIYDIFDGMRKNLIDENAKEAISFNWQQLTTFLLSGGTAAAAVGFAAFAGVAAAGGPIFMLIPILVGVVISALIALLIMAARQALITILVIIAPLAFVAYLLPNTEKYFDKWKGLFGTMLALFPMFAAVVGGAQLAGDAIIQNAMTTDGPNSLNLIILGMGVKVAPVVITPFLLKFSGSLLGKIAGIVNNPGKGLIDRSRNFAQDRADNFTAKQLANTKNPNFLARGAQRIDANKRKREAWRKSHQGRRDATWANSEEYSKAHAYDARSGQIKEIGENRANAHVAAMQATDYTAQNLDMRARASKLDLDVSKARVDANWDEVKAGNGTNIILDPTDVALSSLTNAQRQAHATTLAEPFLNTAIEGGIEARRAQSAQNMQHGAFSNALQNDVGLQMRAGGIDANGSQRALAEALKKQHAIRGEAVDNAASIIEHMNVQDDNVVQIAKGISVPGVNITVTEEVQEAAIKRIAGSKNAKALQTMLDEIDVRSLNENQRVSLSEALKANSSKPKFIANSASANIARNPTTDTRSPDYDPNHQVLGRDAVDQLILKTVVAGKFSAEVLATQEDVSLQRILQAIERNPGAYTPALRTKLREDINLAKSDDILKTKLGERKDELDKILNYFNNNP